MGNVIIRNCLKCSTEFNVTPSKKDQKYCCKECFDLSRKGISIGARKTTKVSSCKECGKEVYGNASRKRNGDEADNKFCNRECYDKFRLKIVNSRIKACKGCGADFKFISDDKLFCSDRCWRDYQKPEPRNCINCNTLFSPVLFRRGVIYRPKNNKTCSLYCHHAWIRNNEERKEKISIAFTGDKHPNWQGGKRILNDVSNRGYGWSAQRRKALKKDGFKCVDCGLTDEESKVKYGSSLDVDHIVPFHNFSNHLIANKLSNLECRCKSCHKKAESKRTMIQMVVPMSIARENIPYKTEKYLSNATLSKYDVIQIRILYKNGVSVTNIHKEFNSVGRSAIDCIVRRKTWKNI